MPIMVQISELSLSDPDGSKIFSDLHFRINRGEWACVSGKSGSGKSIFLELLCGQCRPDRGQILVDGRNILRISTDKLRQLRRRLGIVFAERAFFRNRSLKGYILFKLLALDVSPEDAEERAQKILDLVGLLDQADRVPSELTDFDQQRFALSLALSHEPVFLMLDDPLSQISSPHDKERFLEVLERIHLRRRLTTLMTTTKDRISEKFPVIQYDLIEGRTKERPKPVAMTPAEVVHE